MYGWRGILGQIGPSRGDELVQEFYKMVPEGVLLRYSHGTIRQLDRDNIERQIARIEEEAIDLDECGVDLIMIGGSPLFTTQGVGSDYKTCARIQQKVSVPVTATVTAEVEALRTVGAKKIVLATPFEEWLDQTIKGFLEGSGFEVVNMGGLGVKRNADLPRVPDHSAYRLAKKVYLEAETKPDAVFIHCPRWPVISYIELLEKELGCPVVATTPAITWHALRLMNIRADISGYGSLLRTLA